MANTSSRTLRLLSLLQTSRFWAGKELAEKLGVSERTLRRDIDRLRELGYRVNATPGVAGGYQLRPGSVMPPLLLNDEEAVAIVVGLRAAAAGIVAGIAETSVQALAKLMDVMPPPLRRRVEALRTQTVPAVLDSGPRIDTVTLTLVAQTCRDNERLQFDYTTSNGARGKRLVEPHRLVLFGRYWYLIAWDIDRQGWRSFRVDRLAIPEPTGVHFHQRKLPQDDPAKFLHQRFHTASARYNVVVRIQAPTSKVERACGPWGRVEALDNDSCYLRMDVDEFEWPCLILAAVSADFEVLEPAEFRDYLNAVGTRFFRCASNS